MLVDCSCEPTYQSNVTNKSKLLLVKYHKNRRWHHRPTDTEEKFQAVVALGVLLPMQDMVFDVYA